MSCKQSLLSLFQTTSHRLDMRATMFAATPPVPPNNPHQPRITKPQCNGAAKSSSTNQKACPHSLSPTLGRIIIGPTTSPTKGKETDLLYCGSRVMAYRYTATPIVMYNGKVK